MNFRPASLALTIALLAAGPAAATGPGAAPATENAMDLDRTRRALRQTERFALPGGAELSAARAAFADLAAFRAPDPGTLAEAGLAVPEGADGSVLAVGDTPGDPAGRGLFAVRDGGLPVLVSAPHQFRDLKTGEIAAKLFSEAPYRAAAINTAPRDLSVEGSDRRADLGKLEATHFNAFHRAFHAAHPRARIVQLHGFASDRRKTKAGRAAGFIISSGASRPAPEAEKIAACLRRAGFDARLYPTEVRELGGTRNAQRAALIDAGAPDGAFIHVEMSPDIRETLVNDQQARWIVGTCLAAGL